MKKLLIFILALCLANAASAVITYTPTHSGSDGPVVPGPGEVVYIDIDATGQADYLMSTGELLVTITGDFTIVDLANLTYAPTQMFWDPLYGLITNAELDDPQNARLRAATIMIMDTFWMAMPDDPIGHIGITYGGEGIAKLTIVPNNGPNPWGNTGYVKDGVAYKDLDAVGGTFIIPEPATIALFGLGGLLLLRRRR